MSKKVWQLFGLPPRQVFGSLPNFSYHTNKTRICSIYTRLTDHNRDKQQYSQHMMSLAYRGCLTPELDEPCSPTWDGIVGEGIVSKS
jgi:hypothetical protein